MTPVADLPHGESDRTANGFRRVDKGPQRRGLLNLTTFLEQVHEKTAWILGALHQRRRALRSERIDTAWLVLT